MIEQNLPVLSENELRMRDQLRRYQIQTKCSEEKLSRLQVFLFSTAKQDGGETLREFIQDYREKIEQIKEQLAKMKNLLSRL